MSNYEVKVTVRLDAELVAKLKAEAKERGMIFSRYVAQIIEGRHGGK